MRRFFTRLAVYCGLHDDGSYAPHPEKPTRFTVFVIVAAALIVAVALEAIYALFGGPRFQVADALWHGAVFGIVGVIARLIEHRVHVRSQHDPQGARSRLP